jgi:hypothetical protein
MREQYPWWYRDTGSTGRVEIDLTFVTGVTLS